GFGKHAWKRLPPPKGLAEGWPKKSTDSCKSIDDGVMLSEAKHLCLLCVRPRNEQRFFASLRMTFSRTVVHLWIALWLFALSAVTQAQTLAPAPAASPSAPPPDEETIIPTFETQKLARTYILDVPAPRGQITDRNGAPLAQNRLTYNLVISYPTPLDFSDEQAVSYTREKIDQAAKSIGRRFRISDETILRHYRNRGIMPFEIAQNLSQQEYENIKDALPAGMIVRPIYVR